MPQNFTQPANRQNSNWRMDTKLNLAPEDEQDVKEIIAESLNGVINSNGKGSDQVNNLLLNRETTHGCYRTTAQISQDLKNSLRRHTEYDNMPDVCKESLDLICTKMARIVSGNSMEDDHWDDIGGYAKLPLENKDW